MLTYFAGPIEPGDEFTGLVLMILAFIAAPALIFLYVKRNEVAASLGISTTKLFMILGAVIILISVYAVGVNVSDKRRIENVENMKQQIDECNMRLYGRTGVRSWEKGGPCDPDKLNATE
jgi:hypothetical protein